MYFGTLEVFFYIITVIMTAGMVSLILYTRKILALQKAKASDSLEYSTMVLKLAAVTTNSPLDWHEFFTGHGISSFPQGVLQEIGAVLYELMCYAGTGLEGVELKKNMGNDFIEITVSVPAADKIVKLEFKHKNGVWRKNEA